MKHAAVCDCPCHYFLVREAQPMKHAAVCDCPYHYLE